MSIPYRGGRMTNEEIAELIKTINNSWIDTYGGEDVSDLFALQVRVRHMIQDRNDWAFNARVLQKAYNELQSRLKGLTQPPAYSIEGDYYMNTTDLINTLRIAADSQENIALKMLLIMASDRLEQLNTN